MHRTARRIAGISFPTDSVFGYTGGLPDDPTDPAGEGGGGGGTPKETTPQGGKPPWGEEENFDAARAWELIQDLRRQKNDPSVAKELEKAQKRISELEDEKKTELQRAQDRAEAAEKALADRDQADEQRKKDDELRALRESVAEAKKVPVGLLVGTTKEELEASADVALEFKGTKPAAPPADGQGDGTTPLSEGKELTAAETVAAALKR